MSGFLFGYDAGSIGPITEMYHFYQLSSITRGLVVASILTSVLPQSILAGPLSDRYGRVFTMTAGGLIGIIGVIICCSSFSLTQFIIGRVVVGAGQGLYFTISGVWQVESAPTSIRGRIGAMSQTFIPIGIAVGFFVSYKEVIVGSTASWRVVSGVPGIVTILMTVLLLSPIVPESPRWLLLKGGHKRVAEAERLVRSYASSRQAGDEDWGKLWQSTDTGAPAESQPREPSTPGSDTSDKSQQVPPQDGGDRVLHIDRISSAIGVTRFERQRSFLSILLILMAALSGADAVIWYAPLLFSRAGIEGQLSTFAVSGIMAIVMMIVTILSHLHLIDRLSRRWSIGVGASGMAVSLFIIGGLSSVSSLQIPVVKYASICFVFIYMIFFQVFVVGPIFVVAVEIVPTHIRSNVSALSRAAITIGNLILAAATPKWVELSLMSFFLTLGCFNLITVALAILFIPETLNMHLERITDRRQLPDIEMLDLYAAGTSVEIRPAGGVINPVIPESGVAQVKIG